MKRVLFVLTFLILSGVPALFADNDNINAHAYNATTGNWDKIKVDSTGTIQ